MAIIVLMAFKATPIAEQLNNLLMERQNLFIDIFVQYVSFR
jgi:hypothetical protein